jgi:hypothetical protein
MVEVTAKKKELACFVHLLRLGWLSMEKQGAHSPPLALTFAEVRAARWKREHWKAEEWLRVFPLETQEFVLTDRQQSERVAIRQRQRREAASFLPAALLYVLPPLFRHRRQKERPKMKSAESPPPLRSLLAD